MCIPVIPALRFGQEVGEFQANLGFLTDSVSKLAKQKNWVFEVGGVKSGLGSKSEQSSPDIIAQADQEPFPEGILGELGALQGECEGRQGTREMRQIRINLTAPHLPLQLHMEGWQRPPSSALGAGG